MISCHSNNIIYLCIDDIWNYIKMVYVSAKGNRSPNSKSSWYQNSLAYRLLLNWPAVLQSKCSCNCSVTQATFVRNYDAVRDTPWPWSILFESQININCFVSVSVFVSCLCRPNSISPRKVQGIHQPRVTFLDTCLQFLSHSKIYETLFYWLLIRTRTHTHTKCYLKENLLLKNR